MLTISGSNNYAKDIFYEVNIRQYTEAGTIQAFTEHLPRLAEMGITVIWLMPHYPIGEKNRKGSMGSYYSIRDYQNVNPEFGTLDDFKTMVKLAHELGLKVIIDWVANHAAWDHIWTLSNPEFFIHEKDGGFYSPFDWTDVIQFDHHHEPAHQALRDAMCFWIQETDIDGFRADLAHLTPLHFWKEARKQCEAMKPGLIWLAETEDASFYEAFDLMYAWKWMHGTESFVKNHLSIASFFEILQEQNSHYPNGAKQLYFTSNHDENSWNGTEFEKYGCYADVFAIFSFLYPNAVPLIYSGQEIPNLRRLAFFEKESLNWSEGVHKSKCFQKLAHLRKSISEDQSFQFLPSIGKCLSFKIGQGKSSIWVWLNLDTIPQLASKEFDVELIFLDYMNSVQVTELEWEKPLEPGEYRIWIQANAS
jgi:alpha-amylase